VVNFHIYLAVIVSGASVLAIELLGTRILAPFYGAGLYLWSALISVTLAALSVGYAIGGHWADRGPRLSRFALIIGIAGLWIAVIPWLRQPVLACAETAGLRAAVLITATILFFPPLALLGMVSPYAIRLKASRLDEVGRTAGNLYALSTVASVAAAIATGFFLIPNVGVSRLVFLIGFALVATAALGLAIRRKPRSAPVALPVLVAAGILAYWVAPAETANPDSGLIAVEQSAYGEIRVVDLDDARYMLIDGGMHTGVDTATWDSFFEYVYVLDVAKGFFDRPGEMLLVGLGGGSVVKSFQRDGWRVDAVEIDPVVTKVARTYFGLRPDEAEVYEMDARQFLLTHEKEYDLIVMDAFGSSSIPFHLVTAEAFGLIRSHLKPGGILAMNVEAVGWRDLIVRSLAATAHQQFDHVTVLPIAEPPDQLGNLVLLASNRVLDLKEEPPVPQDRSTPEYDRAHAWDNRFEVDDAGIPVLTDELNPIDTWSERVNLVARRRLHEFFDKPGIAW
jgi:spermidine synthase